MSSLPAEPVADGVGDGSGHASTPATEPRRGPYGIPENFRIIRVPEVCRITGLKVSSVYRLEACGLFPRRVQLSQGAVGWVADEVHAWIFERIAKR